MIDPNEKIRRVELVEYNPEWPQLFSDEARAIKSILKDNCVEIYHIGSTVIPNICAKPIIDILPVVKNIYSVDSLNHEFEKLNYVCMGEYGIPGRRFYWKSKIKRTHHIHLFQQDSPEILRHVAFKNFLIANENYAHAYSLIKKNLANIFFDDIENYVDGKASFVQMIEYKSGSARIAQLHANDGIVIEPYNPAWEKLATAEIKTIKEFSNLSYVLMEHIGSTAVPTLSSKPIIDILIAITSIQEAEMWIRSLEMMGYIFWAENPDKSHLRFFKGMPPFGKKRTHHIHLVEASNKIAVERILFRDILRRNEKIRMEYELLKLQLAKLFPSDREKYTDGKSEFIQRVLRVYE